jgi:Tfp pilus assembly protein PilX
MSRSNQRGFILLTVMTTTIFVMMIGVASLELISSNLRTARAERYLISAQFAADAGLDDAIHHLNQDGTWTGSGSEQTLYSSSEYRTTYQTTVTSGSNEFQKFISVEAKAYTPASASSARYTRKYVTEMRGVASGNYSVVSGVGGLTMTNSSKILGGQVYVNGQLSMDNTAQIGLSTLPVNVSVAHQSCPTPADTNYPRVCNSGENGEPIKMLSPNTKIYGEVKGTNQTTGTNMFNPGLVSGSPAPAPLPTHDRTAQKSAVANTTSGAIVSCSNSSSYTWTANTKIVGDVSLSKCDVTIEGDIWITGSVTMTNGAKVRVKSGLTTPPVIMIDGNNGLTMRNSSQFASNTNPTPVGFRVITYASNASCSPDCATVTGTDLYNSRDKTTLLIETSSEGPGTQFLARWSKLRLDNSGNIGALAAQTVTLENSSAVTFGTTITGFTGPQAWVVKSYKRTF